MGGIRPAQRMLFVDSGGWISVNVTRDRFNAEARKFYQEGALKKYSRLITTNLVVAETHAYLLRKGGREFALRYLHLLDASTRVSVVHSDPELETEAQGLLMRFQDQKSSFCDAVSFVVMEEYGIRDVFTFDRHFEMAGFRRLP